MKNVLDILEERGLLDTVTEPGVRDALDRPTAVYAGFDPSSDSLQAGNFVTIMALCHYQRCGHRVIAVVGGATGMIGDPSGKSSERNLLTREEIERNQEGIRENLSRFLDFDDPVAPATIVNNIDWLGPYGFVDFLRDIGKHFRMGAMLGKESVRARLAGDAGMSFTEFSYQLLQAYDFLRLYDDYGCHVQIGGTDQWGNITAGTDLIRRLRGAQAYGVTVPLVCDSAGQKFGKSEGNAVYLDRRKTSYYDFYQFFIRAADADVVRYLKIFTFLPIERIEELAELVRTAPERREAQRVLAEEVTRAVHGETGLAVARKATAVLFGEAMEGLCADDILGIFANVPSTSLALDAVRAQPVVNVAVDGGLCASRGEARRLVQNGGLYLNNRRVTDVGATVPDADVIDGKLLVLRSGKKRYQLVRIA